MWGSPFGTVLSSLGPSASQELEPAPNYKLAVHELLGGKLQAMIDMKM